MRTPSRAGQSQERADVVQHTQPHVDAFTQCFVAHTLLSFVCFLFLFLLCACAGADNWASARCGTPGATTRALPRSLSLRRSFGGKRSSAGRTLAARSFSSSSGSGRKSALSVRACACVRACVCVRVFAQNACGLFSSSLRILFTPGPFPLPLPPLLPLLALCFVCFVCLFVW